jgi:hypothetical protein
MVADDERSGAFSTAAVAAVGAAIAYGLKHVLEERSETLPYRDVEGHQSGESGLVSRAGPAADTARDLATHTLLPIAESAAHAAGKWVAENAPDVVRDRVVRRFIAAFNDTAGPA